MTISKEILLGELNEKTISNLKAAEQFLSLDTECVNWKENPTVWSVLECLEHLNRYGVFYLPEIKRSMESVQVEKNKDVFKSGWLGNYFAKSMLPKEKLNKMGTFKSMNPLNSNLNVSCIHTFVAQQKETLNLLKQAKVCNLTKSKTATSISRWINLRLGDTLRVVIYHNERHIVQAHKVLSRKEELDALV